jgi:phosphatidate cytidylyltransferase
VRERIASSAIIVIVVLLPTIIGGPVFALLLLIVGLAAYSEYRALVHHLNIGEFSGSDYVGVGTISLFAVVSYFSGGTHAFYATVALAAVVPLVLLLRTPPNAATLGVAALLSLGSIGLGLAVYGAIALRGDRGAVLSPWLEALAQTFAIGSPPTVRGLGWVLVVIIVTWVNDSGAYLIGRSVGRHALAPTVSPRKTIEGSAAGLIGAALAGACGFVAFGLGAWWLGALSGAVIGVAGQIGDLAESYLKRSAGVKDSGNLIPGHGGLLDRIDGLMFAFPAGFILASALERLGFQ